MPLFHATNNMTVDVVTGLPSLEINDDANTSCFFKGPGGMS
jgi:hypothetical protein